MFRVYLKALIAVMRFPGEGLGFGGLRFRLSLLGSMSLRVGFRVYPKE